MCVYSVGNSSWKFINKFETMRLLLKHNIWGCTCTDIMFISLLLCAWHHATAYAFIYIFEFEPWEKDMKKQNRISIMQKLCKDFDVFSSFLYFMLAFVRSLSLHIYRSMSFKQFSNICLSNFHTTLLFSAGCFWNHSRKISCTANGIFNANTLLQFI